jgi:pyruvate dehydrogenase (quinone)/pyruvate oxidase
VRFRPNTARDGDLRAAAQLLDAGARPAILAGIGARGAGALIERVADTLGAPVIKTLSGKMVVPDDSPYVTGGIGLLGTAPSAELVEDSTCPSRAR